MRRIRIGSVSVILVRLILEVIIRDQGEMSIIGRGIGVDLGIE